MQVLSHRAKFSSSFYEVYIDVSDEVCNLIDGYDVEDRLWRNWAILLTSYKILQEPLRLPFEYNEIRDMCIEGIKRQNGEVTSNNELGNLWSTMNTLFDQGKIFADSDFKVKRVRKLKTSIGLREFKELHPILMLRLSNFVSQYKQLAQREGEKKIIMDKDSIRYYLTTCNAYLGEKKSERYTVMRDGVPVMAQVPALDPLGHAIKDNLNNDMMKMVPVYKDGRFLCFDYQILHDRFGLRLETFTSIGSEEDDEDKEPEYQEGEIF